MHPKIEKDIPMPNAPRVSLVERKESTSRVVGYPFPEMAVGDSVFYTDPSSAKSKAANAARVYGHRTGKKFKMKKCTGGIRIWRTI